MRTPDAEPDPAILRARAVALLTGATAASRGSANSSAALGVLYNLASSPSTAPGALALLHELQVHQVEMDLQSEELRRSRAELETSLDRHIKLYDQAPVGYFALDLKAVVNDLNLYGAGLLGFDRELLRGRLLDEFLTPDSARSLHALILATATEAPRIADLTLRRQNGATRRVHASIAPDPAGNLVLLALMEAADPPQASTP